MSDLSVVDVEVVATEGSVIPNLPVGEVKIKAMPKSQLAGLMNLFGGSNSFKHWIETTCLPDGDGTDLSFELVQKIVQKQPMDLRLGVIEERSFFLYLVYNVLVKKEIKLLEWLMVQDSNSDFVSEDDLKTVVKLAEHYNPEQLNEVLRVGFEELVVKSSVLHLLLAFGKQKKLFDCMDQWAQDLVLSTFKNEPSFGLENEPSASNDGPFSNK
jgi:hypothetical protein